LVLDEHRHELARCPACFHLGDGAVVEPEPRNLLRALAGDPRAMRVDHAVDLVVAEPDRRREPRGLAPRHRQRPPSRAPRAPALADLPPGAAATRAAGGARPAAPGASLNGSDERPRTRRARPQR